MTRKEQIEQESAIRAAYVGGLEIVGNFSEDKLQTYQNGFVNGAEWADNNPKNPWISVDDDLPCNNREYIDPEYNICTFQMLVKCKDGIYRLERMAILGGKWQWIGSGDDITHWMPVPPFSE